MRAQARAREIPLDRVDLTALDDFLMSERSPPNSMMLSDLDGFLTGIAIGPELVMPSEWLPVVFGGDAPAFADEAEAQAILGTIMARYNEILRQFADDDLDPVFWASRAGALTAADWAKGFLQAIMLRADAWERLFKSNRDGQLLVPILALCGDENGESLLSIAGEEEDRVMEEAAEFIPACVSAIAAYWRGKGPQQISMPLTAAPSPQAEFRRKQDRTQPTMPVRIRQKVQKVLRQSRLKSTTRISVIFAGAYLSWAMLLAAFLNSLHKRLLLPINMRLIF